MLLEKKRYQMVTNYFKQQMSINPLLTVKLNGSFLRNHGKDNRRK